MGRAIRTARIDRGDGAKTARLIHYMGHFAWTVDGKAIMPEVDTVRAAMRQIGWYAGRGGTER